MLKLGLKNVNQATRILLSMFRAIFGVGQFSGGAAIGSNDLGTSPMDTVNVAG